MSGSDDTGVHGLVEAAQRAAGVVAAHQRGDTAGVATLMDGFGSDKAAAGGFLVLSELLLGLYREQTGQTTDECVQELVLHLENAVARADR